MELIERVCGAVDRVIDGLYRPAVIVLLCAISYQVGNLQ